MPGFSAMTNKLLRSVSRHDRSSSKSQSSRGLSSGSGAASYVDSTGYSDAPPKYTHTYHQPAPAPAFPSPPGPPAASAPTGLLTAAAHQGVSDDDMFANLANFDTILLIDDSASMSGSRWREAELALKSIAEIIARYDEDGIDIYFLNHKSENSPPDNSKARNGYYNVKSKYDVESIFNRARPYGATYTGKRLEQILIPYMKQLSKAKDMDDVKPINLIVITDGEPSDNPAQAIVQTAHELDKLYAPSYQVGIQFFQIGSDVSATRALEVLDDDLSKRGVRDIVDTTPCQWEDSGRQHAAKLTGAAILKVVLGAVDKRIDNTRLGNNKQ
ncbi:von Willebrand factor [Metarhizium album ARSEF 1941]|uniref:von Willebrand factor n=1 Tax=Metarhizium album (strain ARSEF 1941) TaxID=1081103 RepID=A0A0B2X837_METAS|nr:von Willebrand factor [Metarhizium album ARSEF 1941]KHO01928.1 von Willebrand factor [Metarhizium album ARSEF 1941]